jgi:hypothetical protein
MIRVTCACGAAFAVKPEFAGRKGKCPRCGQPVQVPGDGPAAATAGSAPPAATSASSVPATARPAASAAPAASHAAPAAQHAAPAAQHAAPAAQHAVAAARPAAPATHAPAAAAPARGAVVSGARRERAAGGARAKHGSRSVAQVHGGEGGERRSAHPHRKDQPKWLIPVAVLVVVGGGLVIFAMTSSTPSTTTFKRALEQTNAGHLDAAAALLKSIPAGDPMHDEAVAELARVSGLKAAGEAQLDARDADAIYAGLQSLRKDYVERAGPESKDYTPYCRYMLKRAREFLERFPDDPRATEVKGLFPYYAKVATLDTPPTPADVKAEIFLRSISRQFKDAKKAVDEYAQLPGADPAEVAALQEDLKSRALAAWRIDFVEPLRSDGDLEPGHENWRRIAARAQKYLASVEGLDGVSGEALEWQAKASKAMAAGGG